MKKLAFKTNINCSSCVAKATPVLDAQSQIQNWEVDTTNPNKTLTVEGDDLNAEEVISALKEIGYQATLA